ncbi:hypothetical protein V2H45_02810 [Tumidithrix elongata RA019]|uniref:Lipoprotein n=2 Tax=Tumidithrix TaxID=3088355 RepID=A0AAW9PQ84_9CYAN|nr:hypothetical protein [Tumidithrix elongata RA019]
MVGDTAKKAMEKNGLNEFKGKIVLNSDGTFEAMVKISGTDPKETKPTTSEIKAKGDFKVEANIVVLTGKSRMVDGKEDKPSPPAKYAISADGKVLKPDANDQLEISFVKK